MLPSPSPRTPAPERLPWASLLVLSAVVFLTVTAEMMPTGLLVEMGDSLDVPLAQVGLLVSVFAFAVVLSSTPLALLTRRVPRHTLLVAVLALFALSTAATALAPTYPVIVGARIVGGACHGLFWAIVGAYAGRLVPAAQLGRAVAVTIGGGTLAFVLGVPLGTTLGHAVGWRASFLVIAVLLAAGAVLVQLALPRVTDPVPEPRPTAGGRSPRDPTIVPVALLCAAVAVTMVGHYAFYTFIVPFATDRLGVPTAAIGGLLFAFGAAGAVGLVLSGVGPVMRRPTAAVLLFLVLVLAGAITMMVFPGTPAVAFPAFALWGVAFGTLPALLQTRLLATASPRIRDTASAVYTSAFNAGIGGGALLGSAVYDRVGPGANGVVYVIALVLGTGLLAVAASRARAARSGAGGAHPATGSARVAVSDSAG